MNCSVSELLRNADCKIVIVDNLEMAVELENAISAAAPEYSNRINKVFYSQKKIGPIPYKNKTPIWDIFKKTEDAKKNDDAFLQKHMRHTGLYACYMRVPAALGVMQKKLVSTVYDAMSGVSSFLINDFSIITEDGKRMQVTDKNPLCDVISWLIHYGNNRGKRINLIWISDLPPRKIIGTLGPDEFESDRFSIYKVIDHKITHVDKEAYGKDTLQWYRTKAAFEKGRSYDYFSEINHLLHSRIPEYNDPAKALSFYKIAAEAGHPGAQFALGRWFGHSRASQPEQEQALYWLIKAAFFVEFEDPDDALLLKVVRDYALRYVYGWVTHLPNGRTILRNQIGARAEEIIKEAEIIKKEAELQAQKDASEKEIEEMAEKLPITITNEEIDDLLASLDAKMK